VDVGRGKTLGRVAGGQSADPQEKAEAIHDLAVDDQVGEPGRRSRRRSNRPQRTLSSFLIAAVSGVLEVSLADESSQAGSGGDARGQCSTERWASRD
jgi:hypothetical protein